MLFCASLIGLVLRMKLEEKEMDKIKYIHGSNSSSSPLSFTRIQNMLAKQLSLMSFTQSVVSNHDRFGCMAKQFLRDLVWTSSMFQNITMSASVTTPCSSDLRPKNAMEGRLQHILRGPTLLRVNKQIGPPKSHFSPFHVAMVRYNTCCLVATTEFYNCTLTYTSLSNTHQHQKTTMS